MITHLGLVIITVYSYEVLKFNAFFKNLNTSLQLYKSIFKLYKLKRVSDHWKEKVMFNYSYKLIISSIKILFNIFLIFIMLLCVFYYENKIINYIFSIIGSLELIIFFIVYAKIRNKFS